MKKIMFSLLLIALMAATAAAQAKVNVVATTEDLAAITREIGGDHITVEALAKGYQDPHFVEAKPSFICDCRKPTSWSSSGANSRGGCRR